MPTVQDPSFLNFIKLEKLINLTKQNQNFFSSQLCYTNTSSKCGTHNTRLTEKQIALCNKTDVSIFLWSCVVMFLVLFYVAHDCSPLQLHGSSQSKRHQTISEIPTDRSLHFCIFPGLQHGARHTAPDTASNDLKQNKGRRTPPLSKSYLGQLVQYWV